MAGGPSLAAAGGVQRLSPADRLVLRLTVAATLGFAVAILLDWQFSFLTPMLAAQIVAAMPFRPGLVQGLAIPLVIFIATIAALAASTFFADAPVMLLSIVGLVVCWTFYGQRRGAPAIIMLLIQISFCGVPLMSSTSLELGHEFAEFLQHSSVAAILIVWVAHALFPAPPPGAVPPRPAGLPTRIAARVAISDTIVLLPLLVAFIVGERINNFVILMATINLLREVDPSRGRAVAVGLLAGNIFGGLLALVAQQFVLLADNLVQFLLTILLAGLWFGARLVRGGPAAPIFALAFTTFLLLIGVAITPLPGGSEEMFAIRIVKLSLASLYALGALALLVRLRRQD